MTSRGWGIRTLCIGLLGVGIVLPAGGAPPALGPTDSARAAVLAQQGAQDAEGLLNGYFPYRAYPSAGAPLPHKFWGPDQTEAVEPSVWEQPENAINPSFAVEVDGDPDSGSVLPRTLIIEGAARGISGTGAATYAANGDHYSLKVTDLSGCIYVNDGVDQGSGGSVSQNLRRILNVLGDVIVIPGLGNTILNNRPAAGYTSEQQLLAAVGNDQALFDRFRDYVTLYAWRDPNVANPVPLSPAMLSAYPVQYYRGVPPVYRMGSSKDAAGFEIAPPSGYMTCPTACSTVPHNNPAIRLYGLDTLNPQWIEIVSRAPVNINAARREVLVALLTNLKGFFVADRRRNNPRWKGDLLISFRAQSSLSPVGVEGDEYGFLMETVPIVGPGGTAQWAISAYDIADEIIACRIRATSLNENYARGRW